MQIITNNNKQIIKKKSLQPTVIAAVPRVLEKIRSGIEQKVAQSSGPKKWLFSKAYSAKDKAAKQGKGTPIWDSLVFKSIQKKMGGKVRGILCGGAYLRPDTQQFTRV